ncbi:MAG TPA: hypothetical protein VGJ12_02235 [Gemmatimonadaceae bacterium]
MATQMNPSTHKDSRSAPPTTTRLDPVRIVALAAALFWFIFVRSSYDQSESVRPGAGMSRVTLAQKDAAFRPIPRAAGGATGVVWYAHSGPALQFILHAYGLQPLRRYLLEIQADDAIYSVASHESDARGQLAIDTTLSRFAEGACVGTNYDAPRSLEGSHKVKFWIKRDGNPVSGVSPNTEAAAPGAALPCRGNGDGDYAYMLMENEIANFRGTGATP